MARKRQNTPSSPEERALDNLPKPILQKLRDLIRRVRRVQIIRGAFATLATAALATIAIMAIDATFTILSDGLRATLTAIGVIGVIITAYRALYRPLTTEVSVQHIARVMETRHPELQERLSTAIELLNSDDPQAIRGSEQLLSQVVKSAIADARVVRPEREFTTRTARRHMTTAAAAAAILALALVIFPGKASRLLTRVIAPFSKVGNAYSDQLQIDPGNLKIPAGDPVTIKVTIRNPEAERAEIRRTNQGTGGPESVETMSLVDHDKTAGTTDFAITFPAVTENFRYRIRSGRAVSAYYDVTAAARPQITSLEVAYVFPSYTSLAPVTIKDTEQDIAAVTGTRIQVRASFDRPLDSAVFKIDGNPLPATQDNSRDPNNPRASWNFEMAEKTEGYWKIALTDPEKIPNIPVEHPIRAIPDRAPTVRLLLSNQTELKVRPDDHLGLPYEATDDFGIAAAKLLVIVGGTEQPPVGQDLPARSPNTPESFFGEAVLNVGKVALGTNQSFQVVLQVEDSLPPQRNGPQIAKSTPVTIIVDSGADSLAEQFVDEQRDSLEKSLVAAIEKLQAAKALATPTPGQLVKPEIIPLELLQQLAKIQTLTGEAENLVRDSATAAAAPSSLFKELAPALIDTADDHLVPARQAAEEIPLTDEKVTRVHRAHKIASELDEAIADLNAAIRELKQMTARARLMAKMSDLAEKQNQLAAELANAEDPLERENLREQQAKLAEEMQELAQTAERSVANQLQDARQHAAQLANRASELAQDQRQLTDMLDQAEAPSRHEDASNELIRWLEAEQREIGNDSESLRKIAKQNLSEPALVAELANSKSHSDEAADALTENRLSDAARTAASNARALRQLEPGVESPSLHNQLAQLAERQESIARQIDALDRGQLDDALTAMQDALAEQAADLAENADELRQQAEMLADPAALQQVQEASTQASQAAQSARQASSQLGGTSSDNAFEFAESPSTIPQDQNSAPGDPPPPTQAGVGDPEAPPAGDDELPDMSAIEGTRENPFSAGEVATGAPPPALEDGSMSLTGGESPPGPPSNVAQNSPQPSSSQGTSSGQESTASAARQPAMQAQHGLSGAASSLSNAAGSLAQQANSPSAQNNSQISQQMLEAARQAAQAAAEKNPNLAAKIAESVAQNLRPRTTVEAPTPSVEDWARVRGQVKSGLASAAKGTTPEEYRDLVKNYFREIARRSSEEPGTK